MLSIEHEDLDSLLLEPFRLQSNIRVLEYLGGGFAFKVRLVGKSGARRGLRHDEGCMRRAKG